jgi:hypothetical protein
MAIADDLKLGMATRHVDGAAPLQNICKALGLRNIVTATTYPMRDAVGGGGNTGTYTTVETWGRVAPNVDEYKDVPIGSTYLQLAVTDGVVTGSTLWLKAGAGAAGWKSLTTSA